MNRTTNKPDLDGLLRRTSRTFALSIPLLGRPLRHQVGLAYLLFRIADTFEDSDLWDVERRKRGLADLKAILNGGGDRAALGELCRRDPPTANVDYLELMIAIPGVMDVYDALPEPVRRPVGFHLSRTIDGMSGYLDQFDGGNRLALRDVDDLRRYCYMVAGIVGEMLTDLYVADNAALEEVHAAMLEKSVAYGEGLQLTNIVKDAGDDAKEGRFYLPAGVALEAVIALAEADLVDSVEYVNLARGHGGRRGLIRFLLAPLMMAFATLEKVRRDGSGAKISRAQVARILLGVERLARRRGPLTVGQVAELSA